MTTTFTTVEELDAALIKAMRDTVAEAGRDHVYDHADDPSNSEGERDSLCYYANDAHEPLCIVGHALYRIDSDLLPTQWVTEAVGAILEREFKIVRPSNRVRYAYYVAQRIQDSGLNWGVSLDAFEEVLTAEDRDLWQWAALADSILARIYEERAASVTV